MSAKKNKKGEGGHVVTISKEVSAIVICSTFSTKEVKKPTSFNATNLDITSP